MYKKINIIKYNIFSTMSRAGSILKNEKGYFYISEGVNIIIAFVLGALLLDALSAIFNDTVIPIITSEIEALFG